jgi:1-acyl-sn-glycerol-3-phosphate acyltransferase
MPADAQDDDGPRDRRGVPTPQMRWIIEHVMGPVARVLFRPTIEGLEHLPDDEPFLLVANHSAGMGVAELLSFTVLYLENVGDDRPLAGFAHPISFRVWPLTWLMRELGAVPSTYQAAEEALEAGVPLLMFPGGDHETLRPVWRANSVDFGGRTGFLKIAEKAGVPVVPMGISGSHLTAPILVRSKMLAWLLVLPRLLGLKRWGISLLGVLGAVALAFAPMSLPLTGIAIWFWLVSPLVFLPIIPWTIRFRIGPPISSEQLFDAQAGELTNALDHVENTVEQLVTGA